MGAMLAGVFLRAYYGFLSIAFVVLLTALGLPLLDGAGGLAQILGPNGGYIFIWPLSDPQCLPILWRTQHQSDVLNPNVCRDLGAERTSACRDESILASPKGVSGEPLLSSVG